MTCFLKYAASTKLGCLGKIQVNLKLREERIIIVKERPRLFSARTLPRKSPGDVLWQTLVQPHLTRVPVRDASEKRPCGPGCRFREPALDFAVKISVVKPLP